ncbi:hypothetical protein JL721_5383 [Aureococcus anophagefferens]|nr:hypothetical protein JL721_5383 [Aureococcus anophagefferens]
MSNFGTLEPRFMAFERCARARSPTRTMLGMARTRSWFGSSLPSCTYPRERACCDDVQREVVYSSVHDPPRPSTLVENVLLESTLDRLFPLDPKSGALWCDETFWFDSVEGDEDGPEDDRLLAPAPRLSAADQNRRSLKAKLQGEWVLTAADVGDDGAAHMRLNGRSWVAIRLAAYVLGRNVGHLRQYFDVHGDRVTVRQTGLPSFTTHLRVDCGDARYPPERAVLTSGYVAPGTHAWDGATLATTITKPGASGGFDGFSREFRSDSAVTMGRRGSVGLVLLGVLYYFHDAVITVLPKPVDDVLLRCLYPREKVNTNAGSVHLPHITYARPIALEDGEDLSAAFDPRGYPKLLRNVVARDQDAIVAYLAERNAGRTMRMLDYTEAIESGAPRRLASALYAGFEAITDADAVAEVVGVDITELGGRDYRLNQLFTSNFANGTASAALHCAPIDSVVVQLVGTKTWYFVAPDDLKDIPATPMPTFFAFPHTDDELVARVRHVHVVKQRPGDVLYFGPSWCHAVWTEPGPNVMFNMRYNAPHLVKAGPRYLFWKVMARILKNNIRQKSGINPQDNKKFYGRLYEDLMSYYADCGRSDAAEKRRGIAP